MGRGLRTSSERGSSEICTWSQIEKKCMDLKLKSPAITNGGFLIIHGSLKMLLNQTKIVLI